MCTCVSAHECGALDPTHGARVSPAPRLLHLEGGSGGQAGGVLVRLVS